MASGKSIVIGVLSVLLIGGAISAELNYAKDFAELLQNHALWVRPTTTTVIRRPVTYTRPSTTIIRRPGVTRPTYTIRRPYYRSHAWWNRSTPTRTTVVRRPVTYYTRPTTTTVVRRPTVTYTRPATSCPYNCFGRGLCTSGVCHCYSGYTGSDCSLVSRHHLSQDPLHDFWGCNPPCKHGTCFFSLCVCKSGWSGKSCDNDGLT